MKPSPYEKTLIGAWLTTESGIVADSVAERIRALIGKYLRHIGVDGTGWDHLYLDPEDGRLWELTYPLSAWHGGGPPRLDVVSREVAQDKYGWMDNT
jgi:hypothetical protein